MNKKSILVILVLSISTVIWCCAMSKADAGIAAQNKLIMLNKAEDFRISGSKTLESNGQNLAYVFELDPEGYIVITAESDLPPIIAYSFRNRFFDENCGNILQNLLISDLQQRWQNIEALPVEMIDSRNEKWNQLLNDSSGSFRPEQWPPEGTSATGGWLPENWSQSYPYNMFCPLDPVDGNRSIAGCPSIAMAQILNFHRTSNSVYFDDADDYFHNYSGRQFWIDDDHAERDFLSFPELNTFLDSLEHHYNYGMQISDEEKAALVFACGVAARQIYTSQVSGTFGVDQAYDAFQKFNFDSSALIDEDTPDFYEQIVQNIMDGLPVHFASVTPAWDSGHNFVVDGYNTDGYYHINFGWNGSFNGWYLLPDEIPYGLTVVEGAIVDIVPEEPPAGFIAGGINLEPAASDSLIRIECRNNYNEYIIDLEADISGSTHYILQVQVGNYNLSVSYPGYETIILENIFVQEWQTTNVDFELEQLTAPVELEAYSEGNRIFLNWQHPAGRDLSTFNIYRNINGNAFTLLDTTSELSYVDSLSSTDDFTYGYRITAVYSQNCESGSSNTVFIDYNVSISEDRIKNVRLKGIFPNPFNPSTRISFCLNESCRPEVIIFNIRGQMVNKIQPGELRPGTHSLVWNGKDDEGKKVTSGIYYITLKTEDNIIDCGKVLLLK